jgi:anti-sigma regulatory factor (Ser/Thr protein kinase)
MIGASELRIVCRADAGAVTRLRHALRAFLDVFPFEQEFLEDVVLASGEALANAVEHGADPSGGSDVEIFARCGLDDTLAIGVSDSGRFIEREKLPNRGLGLKIVHAIARSVTIDTARGTRVEMLFDAARPS